MSILKDFFKSSPHNPPVRGGAFIWNRGRTGKAHVQPPEFSGVRFYATLDEAIIDDVGGTYTGTASEDIVFPPSIAYYLLAEIGGITNATIGASTFGSFITATTDINALVAGDWEVIARHSETTTVLEAIDRLMSQAPFAVWRSPLDNKMKCQVYKTAPASQDYFQDLNATNYKWSYKEDMIEGSVKVELSPLDEIINEVHVKHALHAPTGEYTRDAWVGPSGSDNGVATADEGAAGDREDQATDSASHFNVKRSVTILADQIYRPEVAVVLRNMIFDRFQRPRVLLTFDTWGRATTMDLHMNTLVNNELQDYIPCPKYPYNATAVEWDDLIFYVRRKLIFNDGGRIRHRITLEEVPQPL